ncbi:MAG: MFS transporter [Acidimicrobiia bacterium]
MSTDAPFVPKNIEDDPIPSNLWVVFRERGYWRLFVAQCVSSLGDWIGIFAIIAIAARVNGSEAAISLVMIARIVPGFFLASIGGLLVDKWDRRITMVVCDIGRALLLFALPFFSSLAGLVIISFLLEILTLLWGPAKDASVPHLINKKHLSTANSLSLVAAYGTFPIGSIVFAAMARIATLVNSNNIFSVSVDKEFLALWVDASTFLISASLIFSLTRIFRSIRKEQIKTLAKKRRADRENGDGKLIDKSKKLDVTKSMREIKEGYSFIIKHRLVRGVMLGLGVGIIGGGGLVPLGPKFAVLLGGGSAAFSLLMAALGTGAAIGMFSLLAIQKYLKRGTVFWSAIVLFGVSMMLAGLTSNLLLAIVSVTLVGAFAGSAYVTGFTVLQEEVQDDVRGRTFAALYAIIRVCMIFALTTSPLFAVLFEKITKTIFNSTTLEIGSFSYAFPGVRSAIVFGGLVAVLAGFLSRSQVVHAKKDANKNINESIVEDIEDSIEDQKQKVI